MLTSVVTDSACMVLVQQYFVSNYSAIQRVVINEILVLIPECFAKNCTVQKGTDPDIQHNFTGSIRRLLLLGTARVVLSMKKAHCNQVARQIIVGYIKMTHLTIFSGVARIGKLVGQRLRS